MMVSTCSSLTTSFSSLHLSLCTCTCLRPCPSLFLSLVSRVSHREKNARLFPCIERLSHEDFLELFRKILLAQSVWPHGRAAGSPKTTTTTTTDSADDTQTTDGGETTNQQLRRRTAGIVQQQQQQQQQSSRILFPDQLPAAAADEDEADGNAMIDASSSHQSPPPSPSDSHIDERKPANISHIRHTDYKPHAH